ncbi:MAG: multiheme c-type cytochrome, partial [Pseudomonadota bacterium]
MRIGPLKIVLKVIVVLLPGLMSVPDAAGTAQVCDSCHEVQFQAWQQSDHFHAMQIASDASVLGDFEHAEVSFHDIESTFSRKERDYVVKTMGSDGTQVTAPIRYTFGHDPLQQYLVEMEGGRLQALNLAWDTRPVSDGGQRWFHLQPDESIKSSHPFFWTRHFSNWNTRCADCHSTNVTQGYDPIANVYTTRFSEANVSCEACHGDSSRHLALASEGLLSKEDTGYSTTSDMGTWRFEEGSVIASRVDSTSKNEINQCGGCHSRRTRISDQTTGDYFDRYELTLLSEGLYFDDGQIQDEVFVLGSFLQSRMYQAGVTCSNCHQPHSGQLRAAGNELCATCHAPTVFDSTDHHGHPVESAGAACVECHMPARTYMQVDDRRDHRFHVPDPLLSQEIGSPDPCLGCHVDKPHEWADQKIRTWHPNYTRRNTWAEPLARARSLDVSAVDALIEEIDRESTAPIIRATLLQQLSEMRTPRSLTIARRFVADNEPLMRAAAASVMRVAPATQRSSLLSDSLSDDSRLVRHVAARSLTASAIRLRDSERGVVGEYRSALTVSLGQVETQLALADLALNVGDASGAESHFRQALLVEPNHPAVLLQYADFLRSVQRDGDAAGYLKHAIEVLPDNASAHHSYGLWLIRQPAAGSVPGVCAAALSVGVPEQAVSKASKAIRPVD